MSTAAVIVAAGSGTRAGGERPKQYQLIGGHPVLWWTLKAFAEHPAISAVQPVIGAGQEDLFAEATHGLAVRPPIVGGSTRQSSCRIGIEALRDLAPDHVLIHDGARPFVGDALISAIIAGLGVHQGVIPALPVSDTLKYAPVGRIERTVPRDKLWSAQTPQGFRFAAILAAHHQCQALQLELTDDAAVAEQAGLQVIVVPGHAGNVKLTLAGDLLDADRKLSAQSLAALADVRTGQGIDFHEFEPGDHVTLCGVAIPHTMRLKGHSDADVALHALTDAILGALGEGDIGVHFPPSDPQWRGAASEIFLAHAASLLKRRGGRVAHVDLTILAESPKISPHLVPMKANLARILDLAPDRIGIKATTTEGLGAIGRREGMAAWAIATLRLPF